MQEDALTSRSKEVAHWSSFHIHVLCAAALSLTILLTNTSDAFMTKFIPRCMFFYASCSCYMQQNATELK